MGEISQVFEMLTDVERYLSSFPRPSTGLSRYRHLLYHITAYFNEVYILQERVVAYVAVLERKYRRDGRPEVAAMLKQRDIIKASLAGIVGIRGTHVHASRFFDPEMQYVFSGEYLRDNQDSSPRIKKIAANIFRQEYRKHRARWRERIRNNNVVIAALIDDFFAAVAAVVLEGGKLRRPRHWPAA